MLNLKKLFGLTTVFIVQHEEWTHDDTDDLNMVLSHPKIGSLYKLLNNRIHNRTGDLLNGTDTKERIDEIKDLLLELNNHADPR